MKLIKPYVEFIDSIDRNAILQKIEKAGRTCYKSESNITPESASKFVSALVQNGHHAMLEHVSLTVKFVTDRGVSHEIVRHRVASYAQESTRYCTYGANAKRPNEITFIIPAHLYNELSEGAYEIAGGDLYVNNQEALLNGATHVFIDSLFDAERNYNDLIARGWVAQQARAVLPNALKTEIVMTANLREWMHFLNLRSKGITGAPHPDMKVVADMIYEKFHQELPEIFQ